MTNPTTDAAKLLPCPPWRSMKTAPLDETPVLLHTTCHGIVEARYSPGHWEDYHEGREYYGAQWICADDAFQIEVEELPENEGGFHHGTATAWMPLEFENTRPQPATSAGLAMTEAKPLTAEEIADELRDLCACGHERKLHKERGCELCGLQCRQFRFSALNEIRRFYAARQQESVTNRPQSK